tara:strand:+ start:359 stop:685 length:327 start_codon:yes stop_codon:yes gene_type:complete
MITAATYGKDPITDENICVNVVIDGVKWSVPLDNNNTQYKEILEWVAEGNTIEPYVEPEKGYEELRREAYPYIGDQLDMIYHAGEGGDEFQAAIQAVKDAHPKPEEEE